MQDINKAGIPPRQIDSLSYRGASLSLLPVISLPRNPTTDDRQFPLNTMGINTDEDSADYGSLWYLSYFDGQTGAASNAIWVKLSGSGSGPLVDFAVPLGTSPVYPDAGGEVTYTSTGGSLDITGSTNTINFDNPGGGAAIESFILPNGTTPVVPDASGQITLTEGSGITLTGGTNEYTIALAGGGQAVDSFTVPAGTSPVVPDAAGNIDITAGTGITVTGGLNTYEIAMTGGGVGIDSIAVDSTSGAGTDPVLPDGAGLVTFSGAQVAAGVVGANVINVESTAANSLTHQIQQTDAVAAKDTTKNGVAHFDSDYFTDDEGFISFSSGFYETGTWTPVLNFGGATTGITYAAQAGQYTITGNVMHVQFRVVLTSKGSATGTATITGLPYSAGSTLAVYTLSGSAGTVTIPGTNNIMIGGVGASTSVITLRGTTPNTSTDMDNADFNNTSAFGCHGAYWL